MQTRLVLVQKGAERLSDARTTTAACVASTFAFVLAASLTPAFAEGPSTSAAAEVPVTAPALPLDSEPLAPAPVTITFLFGGNVSTFATEARTFGEFLAERGLKRSVGDYVFPAASTKLGNGMRLAYRAAVPLTIVLGKHKMHVRTAAQSLEDALVDAHIDLGPHDEVVPGRASIPVALEVVRVTHVAMWVERIHRMIPAPTARRDDATLAFGHTRVIARGETGVREITIRFSRTGHAKIRRTILETRIVRRAWPAIAARGTALPAGGPARSLARLAQNGLSAALHIAGNAIHVIATAYTGRCYGCSGVTASGAHAGFGVVAVDPRIIPLGTHLFVPGYGRAIAGDTGGAIVGHRVDLGMDTVAEAARFGRRPVTVYVLK